MKWVYKEHFKAFFAFTLLAVLMTLPVVFTMQSNVAGLGGDPWQTMWRFNEKAEGGFTELFQDVFGIGSPRLANLSVWPWMPLHLMLGQPLAYNLIWLLHFILSGYAMALLIKILTKGKSILEPAPMLAGVAYMAMPYHVAQSLGHFGAMQLEWIPFIVASAVAYFRSPTIFRATLLGLLLVVQAWVEHHYIVWIALFGIIAGIVYWKELKSFLPSYNGEKYSSPYEGGVRGGLSFIVLFLILIFGIVLPFTPTIRLAAQNSDALELGVDQTIRFSADIFSFITPSLQHPLWGGVSHALFGQYFTGNESESVQYLGVSILLAILFFHKHIPGSQKRLWVATAIFFGVMSLGPVLHVFGKETSISLPYALLAQMPVFSAIRVIARAGVMVSFATAVLFGWVIATNIHRVRTSYIIGGIILLEFLFIPFPSQPAKLSPAYDALVSVSGASIVEIPAATNYVAASRSLYASSLHGKSTLGNIALERGEDKDAYAFVKSIPGVRQLLYLRTTELTEQRNEFFDQDIAETLPDAMVYMDAHAVLVHTDSLSAVQNTAIENFFARHAGFSKQSFGDVVVYVLTQSGEQKSDGVFVVREKGWDNIGYDPEKQSVFGEIPDTADVRVVNVLDSPVSARVSFNVPQNSPSGVIVRAGSNTATVQPGESGTITFMAQPGESSMQFSHAGSGKSIIQNPMITVTAIPLTPSLSPTQSPADAGRRERAID